MIGRPILVLLCCLGVIEVLGQDVGKAWTLADCISHARSGNLQVRMARLSSRQAGVDLESSKGERLPWLDFSTTQGMANKTQVMGSSGASGSAYTGDYTLRWEWVLYSGGTVSGNIRQGMLEQERQEVEVAVAENDIELAVTVSYLDVLYATENLKTDRQTRESSGEELARARGLLEAGAMNEGDFARLESQYGNDCYRVVQSENALRQARLQLRLLLELEPGEDFDVFFPELDEKSVTPVLPSLEDVLRDALSARPEMKSARLGIEVAAEGTRVACGGYLPRVSLSGTVSTGYNSRETGGYFSQLDDRLTESAGITVQVPISSRKKNRTGMALARLREEQARLEEASTRKDLVQKVETAYQEALSARGRYEASVVLVRSAETSYRLAREEFEAGMRNTVDLLVEKNNYLSALQEHLQAKYQSLLATRMLDFYRGIPINL